MAGCEVPIDETQFVRLAEIARHANPSHFAEVSYDEIAAALAAETGDKPLSQSRIAQIEREALRKLRRILEARGILGPDDILP